MVDPVVGVFTVFVLLVVQFYVGSWWGRSRSRNELRQYRNECDALQVRLNKLHTKLDLTKKTLEGVKAERNHWYSKWRNRK